MPASVTLIGWKEFEAKAEQLTPELLKEVDGEVEAAAAEWVALAVLSAPVRYGTLKGGISKEFIKQGERAVVSNVHYSPYQEWGTGTRVRVPADLQAYALQFKGLRRTVGIHPHPYFFIHKPIVEKSLFEHINNILKTEH